MATSFLQVWCVFLLICVTFSSSTSLTAYRLFQKVTDSIDNDLTEDTSNVSSSTNYYLNSTTSSSTLPTTSFVTSSTTTKSVNSTSNSSISRSSTSTLSSTTPWVTTTDDPKCQSNQALDTVCTVPEALIGEDFWDVYYVMFSDDVIRALLFQCSSGHWCLKDRYDFWDALMMERAEMVRESKLFNAVCEMETLACLHLYIGNYTECELYPRMVLTLQSINLLCQLKQEVTTAPECLQHVIALLHVTIVDILRDQNQKEQNAVDDLMEDSCKSPESQITRSFLCLEHKCQKSVPVLTSFAPWSWFIEDISKISEQCGYTNDICNDDTNFTDTTLAQASSISSSTSTGAWLGLGHVTGARPFDPEEEGSGLEPTQEEEDESEYAYDANMLLGMAVTSLILLSIMVIGFFIWWRNLQRDHVVKAGYTQLKCDEV
ncbi:uncharacterized protein LOC132553323 [Ylistrum balloti]|uniref:uncharacterized protein LOC132553323 n=1 Tax=Ylistrum balloti TaxID=509963 RepID=UPI002905A229|nr:uncharacterized protein LOC132553323 [Ylistrum balloti]